MRDDHLSILTHPISIRPPKDGPSQPCLPLQPAVGTPPARVWHLPPTAGLPFWIFHSNMLILSRFNPGSDCDCESDCGRPGEHDTTRSYLDHERSFGRMHGRAVPIRKR